MANVVIRAVSWWLDVRPYAVRFLETYTVAWHQQTEYDVGDEAWLPQKKAKELIQSGIVAPSWHVQAEYRQQGRRRDPSRPRSGRDPYEYLTLNLPSAIHEEVNQIADGERRSMAGFIEEALLKYLRSAHLPIYRQAVGPGVVLDADEDWDIDWGVVYKDAAPEFVLASELGRACVVAEENIGDYLDHVLWILSDAGLSREQVKPLLESARAEAARRGRYFDEDLGIL